MCRLTLSLLLVTALDSQPPQTPAYKPKLPTGAERYESARYTQSIAVVNGRDEIDQIPIENLEPKWRHSGGMEGIRGVRSEKFRTVPRGLESWIGDISVRNSLGYDQDNRGIKRNYPDGTRFDDVLWHEGAVFEHRVREKVKGRWRSTVVYSNPRARPAGYTGLKDTCASCHEQAGTGSYGAGLVPGGDTVLSDPLDWSLVK